MDVSVGVHLGGDGLQVGGLEGEGEEVKINLNVLPPLVDARQVGGEVLLRRPAEGSHSVGDEAGALCGGLRGGRGGHWRGGVGSAARRVGAREAAQAAVAGDETPAESRAALSAAGGGHNTHRRIHHERQVRGAAAEQILNNRAAVGLNNIEQLALADTQRGLVGLLLAEAVARVDEGRGGDEE